MGGLNVKHTSGNRFNIQLEGTFSQKGAEHRADGVPGRNIFDLNYIDLALIAEYPLTEIIALNAGGSYGINIAEKYNGKDSPAGKLFDDKDIGLLCGLKFYIGNIFIRTNYYHGLHPISTIIITNENGVRSDEEGHEYNQVFQVAVGYYFP